MGQKSLRLIFAAVLGAALIGCNMGAGVTPPAGETPSGGPSATPMVVALTPTPPAATSLPGGATATEFVPPTVTKAPEPGSAPIRVSFAAGATYAIVNGTLPANSAAHYVVNIMAGQLLDVSFNTRTGGEISVVGADGKAPANVIDNTTVFRGNVATTQDYTITISSGVDELPYAVQIEIPERITFAKDATQVNVSGKVAANDIHQYVIAMGAHQVLDLELADDHVHTQIYGVDGDVIKSGMGGGAGFRGKVSTAQDYIINVISDGGPDSYNMTLIAPQQIVFAAGATSATLSGTLAATSVRQFAVDAAEGQTLDVTWTPDGSAKMSIYGLDGTVLSSGNGEGTHFNTKLPATETYFIVFQTAASPVNFQLVISIK